MTNELITTVAIRLAGEKFSKFCYDMFLFGFKIELNKKIKTIREIGTSTDAERAFANYYHYRYAEYININTEELNALSQAFADDTGNPDALMSHLDELLIAALYAALFKMIEKHVGKFPIFRGEVSNYKFIKIVNQTLAPHTTDDNHFAKLVEAFSKFQYSVIPNNEHLKMTEDDIKDWVVENVKFNIKLY